jgi:hypothetical protein
MFIVGGAQDGASRSKKQLQSHQLATSRGRPNGEEITPQIERCIAVSHPMKQSALFPPRQRVPLILEAMSSFISLPFPNPQNVVKQELG